MGRLFPLARKFQVGSFILSYAIIFNIRVREIRKKLPFFPKAKRLESERVRILPPLAVKTEPSLSP